jgi:outer membrane protein insertion porin family
VGSRGATLGPRAAVGGIVALVLGVGLLALMTAPSSVRAQGSLEEERTVGRVEIHGNEGFGDGTLKKLLRTRASGGFPFYRKRPLRSDYIRFDRLTLVDYYRRHGYLEAIVDSVPVVFERSGAKADVHFYLTEGPRSYVSSVTFIGVGPVPADRLGRVIELKTGDPLDIPQLDLSRQAVENEYAERGYVDAKIRDSLEVEETRVRVIYRIDPGPQVVLDSVHVSGNGTTKPKFIRREVTIGSGETLERSKLLLSQQRIYDTGFYSDIQFERGPIDSVTNAADLLVGVRERKMGWIDLGIGYGTVDQLRLTSQLGQRNLWRDGVRLVATGRLGVRVRRHPTIIRVGDRRIDAALTRPWNFGVRVAATVGVFAEQVRPRLKDEVFPPYRAYGGSGVLAYDLALHTHSRLTYEHRNVVSDTTNVTTPSGEELASYTTNRLVLSLNRDTRDNPFEPRHGTDLSGTVEFAGGALQGNSQFVKNTGTAMAFVPIDAATVAAFRLRVGIINPQVAEEESAPPGIVPIELIPIQDRFFLGGANTIRGYGENELGTRAEEDEATVETIRRVGGRLLLLVNAEIRRRLYGPVGVELFFDGGNVWERRSDIRLRQILSFADGAGYNDMRYTVGAGLRLNTPIGPVRLDYGHKLRQARLDQRDPASYRAEWHFSVGQAF